jgi:hypothetical protein
MQERNRTVPVRTQDDHRHFPVTFSVVGLILDMNLQFIGSPGWDESKAGAGPIIRKNI